MTTILLADDHPLILRGLRDLFASYADLEVVGETTDGSGVVEAANYVRPNVLVMDLMMPGANGMEIIREVSLNQPGTQVIILSMHDDMAYVWEAMRSGAMGYVLKCLEGDSLVRAVREVTAGRRYLSPPLSLHDLENYGEQVQQHGLDPLDMLTRRERQVLRLAAEGNTSGQIAQQLQIGIRTVESHRANILNKLELRNQSELVRYTIQRGIMPPG